MPYLKTMKLTCFRPIKLQANTDNSFHMLSGHQTCPRRQQPDIFTAYVSSYGLQLLKRCLVLGNSPMQQLAHADTNSQSRQKDNYEGSEEIL